MKLESMSLDELTPQTKSYKVKVTVVDKWRPQVSPKKGVRFQTFYLQDDKNNKVQCTLFGEQIEGFEHVIQNKGKYEISNAPVSFLEDQFKTVPDELSLQMTIDQKTVIQRLDVEGAAVVPDYQSLGSIPRAINSDGKYDVVAIVLFVDERSREIIHHTGRNNYVREVVITDQSNDQPVIVSLWNDLTEQDCERLTNWAASFQVVGFTALRTVTRRGFALTSGMSTRVIHEPIGDRANALREWTRTALATLMDRQARVLKVRFPSNEKELIRISELQLKKPSNALQDERFWIRVTIPDPDLEKVNAYAGCSVCSKRTSVPVGTALICSMCRKSDCVSAHRVTFKFEATDGTGTMSFTTFNDDTEKLFHRTATEIYGIKNAVSLLKLYWNYFCFH